jgi:hypothetical protein
MAKHVLVGLLGVVCVLAGGRLPDLRAQSREKVKKPKWTHALDLKCRKGKMEDFDNARVFGVEAFKDENTDYLIYLSETGSIAVVPATSTPEPDKIKKPEWTHGLELKARKGGEDDFDKATLFGVECFRDENTGFLIYICETGDITSALAKVTATGDKAKKPTWTHALDLKCRKGRQDSFDKAELFGVECFKDDNADLLLYISQTGALSAVTARTTPSGDNVKKPKWSHALDLKCREFGQEDFDKAKVFGVEVFLDENTNNLIYISEKGSVAVVPAKGTVSGDQPKKPKWTHALDLRCRPGREKDFEKAKTYGVEVFRDENTDNLIYITQTGSIAVVPAKVK